MIREVLEEYYLGDRPRLRHPDKLLVFERERGFLLFADGGVHVFLGLHPPSFDYLLLFCKNPKPMTTLDKMNLKRVIQLLCRVHRSTFVEYCDPAFLTILDRLIAS